MHSTNKKFFKGAVLAAGLLVASGLARASVFDHADQLFEQREGSSQNISDSRAEYLRLIPLVTENDLGYAIQQIGRLAVYEGTYMISDDPANNPRKAQIFNECKTLSAKIKDFPSQFTVYTYWRLACSALWIRYATATDRLVQISQIKLEFDDLVNDQLDIRADRSVDLRYQGGGINRVLSGIYSDTLSALIRRGLPNGTKALDMADQALRARAYPGDPNQASDYYSNHRYRAQALRSLFRSGDAVSEVVTAISEIEERASGGDLPVGMVPETTGELVLLRAMNH